MQSHTNHTAGRIEYRIDNFDPGRIDAADGPILLCSDNAAATVRRGLRRVRHSRLVAIGWHIARPDPSSAEWIARQIVEVFPWDSAPQYLLRDRDWAYGKFFRKRLFAMGIRDRPVAPLSPWQNGYVERVIGSIRRDLLDHVIVIGEAHLCRQLRAYAEYYNTWRTHLGLDKDAPLGRPVHGRGRITPMLKLGGLHHAYVRILFLVGRAHQIPFFPSTIVGAQMSENVWLLSFEEGQGIQWGRITRRSVS